MRRWMVILAAMCVAAPVGAQPIVKVYDKFWGGSLFDSFRSCVIDSSGNAYAGGFADINPSLRHNKVVKYNAAGSVVWSQDMGKSGGVASALKLAGTFLIGTIQPNTPGTTSIQTFRLNATTGAVEWTRTDTGFFESTPAWTSTRIAVARGTGIDGNDIRVGCYNLANGSQAWDVPVGLGNFATQIRETPDGNFVVMTFVPGPSEVVVRKLAGANGAQLWERRYPGIFGSVDVLKPSGNVVVGVNDLAKVETLNGNDGTTRRADPMPAGALVVMASVNNSYFAQTDDFSTRVQYRDVNGYLLGTASTIEDFSRGVVDSSGKLIMADERNNNGFFDLKVARELPTVSEFFPINADPEFNISTSASDVASARFFFVSVGQTQLSSADTQARIVLFKQKLEVKPDVFAFRRNQVLEVGTPGFLANDSAWAGGIVGIQSGPSNGTATLNPDKSFRYVPNVGTQQTDSLTYLVRVGSDFEAQTVSFVPLLVSSLDVGNGEIIGGESRTGKVRMNQNNPFHNLVVQLTENVSGLAVTSSIQIPQGKNEGTFNIISSPVATDQVGTISAILDGLTTTAAFTVKRAVPESLTLLPNSLIGGKAFTGTVKMTGNAPAAGYVVNITHSGTEITTPVSVTVPAGTKTVDFAGSTIARSTPITHLVTATSGGVSKTANLTLNPGGLFSFTITPTTVQGGTSANGKVQTAGVAPAGGTVVTMTKDGGNVSVPPTVTVAAGTQFKNFTMTTSAVATTVTRTITATFGTVVKTQTLTITP